MPSSDSHSLQHFWEKVGGPSDINYLLDTLGKIPGVVLGVDRMIRLGIALSTLESYGAKFQRADDASDVLMSLLAVNGEAQREAKDAIRQFWLEAAQQDSERLNGFGEHAAWLYRERKQRLRFFSIAALIVFLTLGAALAISLVPHAAEEVTVKTPSVVRTPIDDASFWPWVVELLVTDIFNRLFAALLVIALGMIWWASTTRDRAAQIGRSASTGSAIATMTPATSHALFSTAVVRRAGRLLRRHVQVAGNRFDTRRSLDATVEAAGYLTVLKGLESRAPDCLLLVDRGSRDDHLCAMADALAKRLRDGGADLLRYEFREFPDILEAVGRRFGGKPVLSLAVLGRRHAGARVVIVSTGRSFFQADDRGTFRFTKPFFGEPEDPPFVDHWRESTAGSRIARVLPAFSSPPILITPTPPDRWGPAERALRDAGFVVISFGAAEDSDVGLESAVEALLASKRPLAAGRRVDTDSTLGPDPLLEELDHVDLSSDIPPTDQIFRDRLARRVMAYACARLGEDGEDAPPNNSRTTDTFAMRTRAAMAALALFPRLDPMFTPEIWKRATSDAPPARHEGNFPSAARLARLARLPWFRAGRMPDWLRADLARHFRRESDAEMARGGKDWWQELRISLTAFAGECLDREPGIFSTLVYGPSTTFESLRTRLRRAREQASSKARELVEERLFLTFLESGDIPEDTLSVDLPPSDRLTPVMRSGALGIVVAAMLAALFAPWGLRKLFSFTQDAVDNVAFLASYLSLFTLLSIVLMLAAPFVASNKYYTTSKRNLSLLVIVTSFFLYLGIMSITLKVVEDVEGPSVDMLVVYFPIANIVVAILLAISTKTTIVGNKDLNTGEQAIVAFVLLMIYRISLDIQSDDFDTHIPSLIICILFFYIVCYLSVAHYIKILALSSAAWQIIVFTTVAAVGFSDSGAPISADWIVIFVSVGLCAFAIVFLPSNTNFLDGIKSFFFLWLSLATALLFPFSSVGSLAPSFALQGIGWIVVYLIVRYCFASKGDYADSPFWFMDYVGVPFEIRWLGRVWRGFDWIDLLLKAFCAGCVTAFLGLGVARALQLPAGMLLPELFGFDQGLTLSQRFAVHNEGNSLQTPILTMLAIVLSILFVYRLTFFVLYVGHDGQPQKERRSWTRSQWLAVVTLWATAIVPLSLETWLSAYEPLEGRVSAGPAAVLQIVAATDWATLTLAALPLAVWFGAKLGRDADRAILIGLMPFAITLQDALGSMPGGLWMIPSVFLVLRLARDAALRRRLLNFGATVGTWRGRPVLVFLQVFALGLVLSPAILSSSRLAVTVHPEIIRMVAFVMIGAMRLPRWPTIAALALHLAISILSYGHYYRDLADTSFSLVFALTPSQALDQILAFGAVPVTRALMSGNKISPSNALARVVSFGPHVGLCVVITMALVLSVESAAFPIGSIDYGPTASTVAILSLALGLTGPSRWLLWYQLSMLVIVTLFLILLGPEISDLAASFMDPISAEFLNWQNLLITGLPSLILFYVYMKFGSAINGATLMDSLEINVDPGSSNFQSVSKARDVEPALP